MQLTTIITCKNRENIKYCLDSIYFCRPRPRCIVVDFGSDIPLGFQNYKSWVKIIRVENNTEIFHKARAINIGIKNVETKFLCITDADQVFQQNFFGVVYNTLQLCKNAFVMCKTYSILTLPKNLAFDPSGSSFLTLLKLAKTSKIPLHGDGCCNGVSTKWAMGVHGYDETYVGYRAQDSDFALRALRSGLKKVWIEDKTSMIHLPHPRTGIYYANANIVRNKKKYKDSTKLSPKRIIIANKNTPWGML